MITLQEQIAAKQFLKGFAAPLREQGEVCYRSVRIRNSAAGLNGSPYRGVIEGPQPYHNVLFFCEGRWISRCSCRLPAPCEHAYAFMLFLLDRQLLEEPAAVAPAPPSAPVPRPPKKRSLKELLKEIVPKLSPNEAKYLDTVSGLYTRAVRLGRLSESDLHPFRGFYGSWNLLDLHPSFPESEITFWHCLAPTLRERGILIPPFMLKLEGAHPPGPAIQEDFRRRAIAVWKEKLAQEAAQPLPDLEEVYDLRLIVKPGKAALEGKRSEQAGFRPIKNREFHLLTTDGSGSPGRLLPEAAILLQAFSTGSFLESDLKLTTLAFLQKLNHLLRLPALEGRMVTAEAKPFLRPETPVRWALRPANAPEESYDLRLESPDGSPLPELLLVLPGQPTLYVTKNAIYRGPPRPAILETKEINSIPAPALETRAGVEFLDRLGIDLPPRLRERTTRSLLKITISCELDLVWPGSDSECLAVEVAAGLETGHIRENFTCAGWVRSKNGNGARKKKRDLIEIFDRKALSALPSALDGLGLHWNGAYQDWRTGRLGKNFAEKFVTWLESLPPHLEVHLDPELATLRNGSVSAFVHLDCQPAGLDWFDLKVILNTSDTDLAPDEIKLLLNARGRYIRLGEKGWRRLKLNFTEEEDARLAQLGLSSGEFSAEPQRFHALQLAAEAAQKLLPAAQAGEIHRRAAELKTRVAPAVPAAIRAQLRPYQIEGFHFLAYLSANHFGGILADDMGLGKTVQTLTWLAWLRGEPDFKAQPSLVVCPKSVMDVWRSEGERFLPDLRLVIWKGIDAGGVGDALQEVDLLVINYTQLRIMAQELAALRWHALILDEGQYIKNPESQTARAARALTGQYRLALSGTPIENRLLDLWSLMSFAMPGILGPQQAFAKTFDQKNDPWARQRLSARVRPFLLRRTKIQVAPELPDRIEEDLYCEIEGVQKQLYRAELKRAQQMLLRVETPQQLNEQRFNFLTSLLRLRQICCHPGLVSLEEKNAESAKVNALVDLLEPLMAEGHKVLVFSQFVSMLEILVEVVQQRGWTHFYLAGETENRGDLVKSFERQPGSAVFLISLKAGGFGLNLTAASYVVLFDPWWNPAVENQAIDRTHRIGQTSKIIAYRLLIKETIEEKIRLLQETKKALAQNVLGEEGWTKNLTLDDFKFLLQG